MDGLDLATQCSGCRHRMEKEGYTQAPKTTLLPKHADPYDWILFRFARAQFKAALETYGIQVPAHLAEAVREDASDLPLGQLLELNKAFLQEHRLTVEELAALPASPLHANFLAFDETRKQRAKLGVLVVLGQNKVEEGVRVPANN